MAITPKVQPLTDEEAYFVALIQDNSGIDLAELVWDDPMASNVEHIFRAWDFQYSWWRDASTYVIDQCARAIGKTASIILRGWVFGIQHPGAEMVITAPEAVHLAPLASRIEDRIKGHRLTRELLPGGVGRGFKHRPFQVDFRNGSKILGRIPQRDGKGVKGCVTEGTLILSEKGHIPVEDLKQGDLVLTHLGRWRPISRIDVDVNDTYEVRGSQSQPIIVSNDHSFYGAINLATPKQRRRFDDLSWFDVEYLEEDNVYWASPTRFDSLPIPQPVFVGTAYKFDMDDDFWWLVGRYLADGFVSRDKKTGKSRKVSWVVHPDKAKPIEDALRGLGFSPRRIVRSHSSADVIEIASAPWERWLVEHFGTRSFSKKLPGFTLGMWPMFREKLLEGYLSGDGHWSEDKKRWEFGSASKALAAGLQLLGQSLGYKAVSSSVVPTSQFTDNPRQSWRVYLSEGGHPYQIRNSLVAKVKSVKHMGKQKVYNPIVEDDHSYVTETIVSHNLHPLRLEMDEAQDYPVAGWLELIETLRHGEDGAQWRAHGVSRGVHDEFYRHSQDASHWSVHRKTGMHRPTWSDKEREEKIEAYGSRDSPDYKRNIYGMHGDATNPLFVVHRLMKIVDDEQGSDYNQDEYYHLRLSDEMMVGGQPVSHFIDFPGSHKQWTETWAGMDVGLTTHPSEILIFGEESTKKSDKTALRLLSRLNLQRISAADQRRIVQMIFDFYKPRRFSMDRGGLGLPVYQDLHEEMPKEKDRIIGYTADQKLVVGWEPHEDTDDPKDFEIKARSKEYGYDLLRQYVDSGRLVLPWDQELLGEWQGSTWYRERTETNPYGKKSFNRGSFHSLDAAAMMVVGKELLLLDKLTEMRTAHEIVPIVFA